MCVVYNQCFDLEARYVRKMIEFRIELKSYVVLYNLAEVSGFFNNTICFVVAL